MNFYEALAAAQRQQVIATIQGAPAAPGAGVPTVVELVAALEALRGSGVRRAGDPEEVPADITGFYYWVVNVLFLGLQQQAAQIAALTQQLSLLSPQAAQALANANLGLANDAALVTRLAATEARQALQEQALTANGLGDAALAARTTALEKSSAAQQAEQAAMKSRLAAVEALAAATQAEADATQAQLGKDEAALAAAQAQVASTAAALAAVQTRLAADEAALAAAQQTAVAAQNAATAAQTRADAAWSKADAAATAATAARAAADAADAKAVAAQTAVLQLQYGQLYVVRAFRNVGATATGATMPTGQAAALSDPAGRAGTVFVPDQAPFSYATPPTVAATISVTALLPGGATQAAGSRTFAVGALPGAGIVFDVLLNQPRATYPMGTTFKLSTSAGLGNGDIAGHLEAPVS